MTNSSAKAGIGKPRIWVAGHRGMVGSALVRRLASEDAEILTVDRRDVDLREQDAVRTWVARALVLTRCLAPISHRHSC